jgi:hypothetical protein
MREQRTRNFYQGAKSDPQCKQPGEMLPMFLLKYREQLTHNFYLGE